MIKVICDGCGKVLPENGENCVNVDFNLMCFGKVGK